MQIMRFFLPSEGNNLSICNTLQSPKEEPYVTFSISDKAMVQVFYTWPIHLNK